MTPLDVFLLPPGTPLRVWLTAEDIVRAGGLAAKVVREYDGRWKAWVPNLSGCSAHGRSRDEALASVSARADEMLGRATPRRGEPASP